MQQSVEILDFGSAAPQEVTASLRSRVHDLNWLFTILICFSISLLVPMTALLAYQGYAAAKGIVLETGCHGPDLPFGMFTGILMLALMRWFQSSRSEEAVSISPEANGKKAHS